MSRYQRTLITTFPAGVVKYFDTRNKVTLQKDNNPKAKMDKSKKKRMKEDDAEDSCCAITDEKHDYDTFTFRPITTSKLQLIMKNRKLQFNVSLQNILEMAANAADVQYLPMETAPQASMS